MTRNARPIERQYSLKRVALMLEVNVSTVHVWIRKGELGPVYKLGHRMVRVPASSVNRFLEARRVASV